MVMIGFNIFGDKILFGLTGGNPGVAIYYFDFWGLEDGGGGIGGP